MRLLVAFLLLCSIAKADPPNVVLLIGDDMHWSHYGFEGHPTAITPNLDWLAERGTVFRNGYCPQPICRPALATLLTGKTPHGCGVLNHSKSLYPNVSTSITTLPEVLRDAGYRTAVDGKWWEGDPTAQGFTHTIETSSGSWTNPAGTVRRGQLGSIQFVRDDVATDEPFFLWWSPQLPHVPHDAPAYYLDLFPTAQQNPPAWFTGDHAAYRVAEADLQACNYWLDAGIGTLLGWLSREGALDNTLIVYLNDNGWVTGGFGKSSPYDHGVRSPVIFAGAGVPQGVSTDLVRYEDVAPTILDYCGLTVPAGMEGQSLNLGGTPPTPPEIVFGFCYGHSQTTGPFAVYARRDDGLKYICWLQDTDVSYLTNNWIFSWGDGPIPNQVEGQRELYDVDFDPFETVNLYGEAEYNDDFAALDAAVDAWWQGLGYDPLPEPAEPIPPPTADIYDNSDAEFAVFSGTWGTGQLGYQGDCRWHEAGDGSSIAFFVVPVEQGKTYSVGLTWPAAVNRATDTPYAVINGQTTTPFVINQEQSPSDYQDGGVWWMDLGDYTAEGTSLVIEVSDDANEYVMIDAVRIEEVE